MKVMVEVLHILAIVTKEIKQGRLSESILGDGSTPSQAAYRFSETFGKKLVGRTGIEDALQRLKTVTEEETRMATAEALKAIHSVGDRIQGIHDAVKDSGEIKQGDDDRVKGIGDMVVIGTQKLLCLSSLFPMFISLGVEKTGRQMMSDPHAIHAGALNTTNSVNNKIENVDNMTKDSMHDTLEGASHGAENVDNVQGRLKEFIDTGAAKISQSIPSTLGDQSRSLSRHFTFIDRRTLRCPHSDKAETRGCQLAISARFVCELLHRP